MKGKRSKQYRKLMHQYQLTFSLREPYQVLFDAAIIKDAARFKMKLGQMLENTLHGEIKPMISQCCIRHLYNEPQSPDKDAWIETAKQAERRRCGHHELEKPLSALECIMSCVDPKDSGNNKNKYVVATQELEIRQKLRAIPGVPLVYINRSVMILEPMASTSEKVKEVEEKAKIRAGLKTRRGATLAGAGEKRKRDDEGGEDGDQAEGGAEPAKKKPKAKGPKGPNPLAVKKAKKEKPKTVGKQVEEERSVLRKAAKQDPQASEKARSAETVVAVDADGAADATRKRKRKRKPKDAAAVEDAGEE
ncbi:rRNA-processing protein utp23 [Fulvia fulva]|uniref:U three protein 23 n=1 Tax=Passalora fulva TaxID=5499 RepID=A0A9Q8LDS7_PASFU|nr:rRNA-processing protein utp23 [Fulvia fulva]KAK4629500.1 rRNA-processing protein utp23 [Fulvia fulva]KAK4630286.1 rRNA-processing protein utp23 [Fulvia fulva]UJO15558.1 rRNA-processing protein utp23 [Fulvia fulva]WPV12572.1 rRNA-processing protein utp23 [Fulvia fulva]WPV27143.1 rRNA-processing protein utp23 [Fulvia fulva]